ncbi:hypothetical protein CEXT_586141 [Caerostris extrusa]|uniref:Uncharacterized protein n=1 Tax=Caerostris extrusa TaxID=172846 RepID=A0AAV4QP28_CAEEX|nr:hypothetical protein CEXT_586141 [Caerostris extrusa]
MAHSRFHVGGGRSEDPFGIHQGVVGGRWIHKESRELETAQGHSETVRGLTKKQIEKQHKVTPTSRKKNHCSQECDI